MEKSSSPCEDGAIAQLGERLICIQEVVGSIPSGSTIFMMVFCLASGAGADVRPLGFPRNGSRRAFALAGLRPGANRHRLDLYRPLRGFASFGASPEKCSLKSNCFPVRVAVIAHAVADPDFGIV